MWNDKAEMFVWRLKMPAQKQKWPQEHVSFSYGLSFWQSHGGLPLTIIFLEGGIAELTWDYICNSNRNRQADTHHVGRSLKIYMLLASLLVRVRYVISCWCQASSFLNRKSTCLFLHHSQRGSHSICFSQVESKHRLSQVPPRSNQQT